MTATVKILEATGPSPAWGTVTWVHYCSDDNKTPSTSYPIRIPDAGTYHSYWKTNALEFKDSFTEISNINVYTDGALGWTGCTLKVGSLDNPFGTPCGLALGSYEQAIGTQGTTGEELTANHGAINAEDDLFSYTSGSVLPVDDTTYSAPGTSDLLITQLDVTSTASTGSQTAETVTWQYDEI